ncbi:MULTISPECIES: leucyl aminopeptidase [Rhodomicrobium]|uniref:leucyl aminopeptidase n=1 Tax=Rhodomicrobium TaxID=1068 RepID=UPI000B4B77AF|nr:MULTISPECIES: leucyl aminopeptidase [Rhodomicrobium]
MTKALDIQFAGSDDIKAKVCVLFSEQNKAFGPALRALDARSGGIVSKAAGIAKFTGGKKAFLDLVAPSGLDLDRLLVVGLGSAAKFTETDWLALGGRIRARLIAARANAADVVLELADGGVIPGKDVALVALGIMLRGYEFKKYKSKKKEADEEDEDTNNLSSLRILTRQADEAASHFAALKAVGDGVMLARDLVNEPANVLFPDEFARRVAELAGQGLEVEVLDQERLGVIGMRALLAVGQGSAQPSCVAIMRWRGAAQTDAKPLVFVGKGVCFDTGGISIKPAAGMEDMKGDMGGAAAVTGVMLSLAARKAPVNAIGIIGLTENMPSGTAQRPGDIVTTLSGQTVEVINTDAEGRLVLADVMWYAQEQFQPRAMVTLATLTGAIIVSLGKEHAGLFSNDDSLAEQLTAAGRESGEKVWRMPLDPKYDKQVNSKVADMKNIGGRDAGSITAAQFLQRFVKPGVAWAHLDIAGTAMGSPATDINTSWGSGYGVMLLDRLARKFYETA